MKSEDAKQLLDNPAFQYAIDDTCEYYIERIKQKPTEDITAAIALSVIDEIESRIRSAAMDSRVEAHYADQAEKYQ